MRTKNMWTLSILLGFCLILASCTPKDSGAGKAAETASGSDANPFFSAYGTPFETPPFDRIREEHYVPAVKEGILRKQAEIEAIVSSSEAPAFANTVEALERSGSLLTRVNLVFQIIQSANTNDAIQAIAKGIAPLLAKLRDDINMNAALFSRIKTVYDKKDGLELTSEQARLLERYYKDFVRGGANLDDAEKTELRAINQELSVLTLKFGENILKETNAFALVLDKAEDLAGLPSAVVQGAADAAKERGLEGKWVFTIHKPSLLPFLQYSEKRDLREKMLKAYINKGNNGNEYDNKTILSRIASLRVRKANILGYKTHADFVLEENMIKTPRSVYEFLDKLWSPALATAKKEVSDLQAMIDREKGGFKLEPWDWWFYAEKVKKAKFDLDDEILRPYFKLEDVLAGAFDTATKLYGIQFVERKDIPVYHPEVRVFEVKEADGTHIGIFTCDYFPRASKEGGAYMNSLRDVSIQNGIKVTPIVTNVGNFTRPTGDKPSLLTFEEVTTLFHEFGHAIHGLFSDCVYERFSGESPRDFVELPSQIMENWAGEPAVIKTYAKHYLTGEPIPDALLEKIRKASLFNVGFVTLEFMAACYLDMDWHTLTEPKEQDALAFEDASMKRIGMIPEIVVRYKSPFFAHIFSGGYSSGYYSYLWSQVLDADAYEAFKETSLFDPATAKSFRDNVLAKGGSEDAMELYKRFRGREPKIDALMKRKGFIN